jgi:sugar diacid utilization regulator
MPTTATTSYLANELRDSATQVANELGHRHGRADAVDPTGVVRPREPFELALLVVQLCAAALEDEPESDEYVRTRVQSWEASGARLALQGVPVTETIEWLRCLEHVVTDRLLACAGIDVTDARTALTRVSALFDALCASELRSYTSTHDELSSWYSRVGTDLVTSLASGGPVEPHTVNGQARVLGINPHQRFRAVAVYHEGEASPQQWARVRRRVLDLLSRYDTKRECVLRDRPGLLLGILPVDRPGPPIPELFTKQLLADEELAQTLFVSAGEPVDALASAGHSCRQALSALEIAIFRGQRGRTVQCTEVILEVLLAHNGWVSKRIVSTRLEPLLEKPHLVDTLRAYISAEMSLQRTAEILVVHPNTVAYRLRQIASLTGRDMRKVTDMADLIVGLTALDVTEMRRDQGQVRADLRARLLA